MTKRKKGHQSTPSTDSDMPFILLDNDEEGLPKYSVLKLGRSWKQTLWQNNNTGNIFFGEPSDNPEQKKELPSVPYSFETNRGLKWDITYSFNNTRRNRMNNGKHYGSVIKNDRLYYILVNAFNGGVDFVQHYLNDIAPHTVGNEVKGLIEPALDLYEEYVMQEEERQLDEAVEAENIVNTEGLHYTKSGELDKRYRSTKAKNKLDAFLNALENGSIKVNGKSWEEEGELVAWLLREDFIKCMMSGQVVAGGLTERTKEQRIRAGLPADPRFFASGQFTESIEFNVRIYNGR